MEPKQDKLIAPFLAQYSSLSLIWPSEVYTLASAVVASLLLLLLAFYGLPAELSALAAASHLSFALGVYNAASRPWAWRWNGLIILSCLHLFAFTASGFSAAGLLVIAYALIALVLVWWVVYMLMLARRKVHAMAAEPSDDEIRWLVTQAPLFIRVKLVKSLKSLDSAKLD